MAFHWVVGGTMEARPTGEETGPIGLKGGRKIKNPYAEQGKKTASEKRSRALTASQIMKAPVRCLRTEATFEETRNFFNQSRFRHVPIVNGEGKLVGIVSDRDVLRVAAEMGAGLDHWVAGMVGEAKSVKEFMTKRVLTATLGAEIRQIARAMFEERIGSMPVVDAHAVPIGIITRSDILRTLVNHAPLELWI